MCHLTRKFPLLPSDEVAGLLRGGDRYGGSGSGGGRGDELPQVLVEALEGLEADVEEGGHRPVAVRHRHRGRKLQTVRVIISTQI